jgi:polar amino acid transport system substrate-binding protein
MPKPDSRGLDPAIHRGDCTVDARVKPAHDIRKENERGVKKTITSAREERSMKRTLSIRFWLVGLALLGLLSAGAGATEVVKEARDALPENIKSAGMLKIATSLQWPPFGYKNEQGDPEGVDIDLLKLIAAKLGLKPDITDVKFPTIIPGVSTGRFDIGANQMSRTAERLQVAQFVVYFRANMGLLVRRGVTDVDVNHLCGRTLALTQGSAQVLVAERLSAQCVKDGKKEITFQFYPNSADTYLAVGNGRGDGFLTGTAVGTYIAKHNDKLQMTKATLPDTSSIAGIVIGKENHQLATAIRLALESAIADGSYRKILEKFGATDGALTIAEVRNPPER